MWQLARVTRRARPVSWDSLQSRGFKHSRLKVVESNDARVLKKKTDRFRREVELYGEPTWEDIKEKMRKSPGRTSLGRDPKGKGYGLGRKDALRGFAELDLLSYAEPDMSTRVQAHMKSRLKSGIPRAVPEGGAPLTHRQIRANDAIFELLAEKVLAREFFSLDSSVTELMNDPNAIVELTRVEFSKDLMNCNVFWTLPFSTQMHSEGVIYELDQVMQRHRGKFRTEVAKRMQKRRAPMLYLKYDKDLEVERRREAAIWRQGQDIAKMEQQLEEDLDGDEDAGEEWIFADDVEDYEDYDMFSEKMEFTPEELEAGRKALLRRAKRMGMEYVQTKKDE